MLHDSLHEKVYKFGQDVDAAVQQRIPQFRIPALQQMQGYVLALIC
jgi:hypothetical protein